MRGTDESGERDWRTRARAGLDRIDNLLGELQAELTSRRAAPDPGTTEPPLRPAPGMAARRLGPRPAAFAAAVALTGALLSIGLVYAEPTGEGELVTGGATEAPRMVLDDAVDGHLDSLLSSSPTEVTAVTGVPTVEQVATPLSDSRFVSPLRAGFFVTDRFGQTAGRHDVHTGIDLAVGANTRSTVFAACTGIVTTALAHASYGNYVEVDCGEGWTTLYGHLSQIDIAAGAAVVAGETPLGLTGSTGYSTGEHLHFEVKRNGVAVDPERYVDFGVPLGPRVDAVHTADGFDAETNATPEPGEPPAATLEPGETAAATPTAQPPAMVPPASTMPAPTATGEPATSIPEPTPPPPATETVDDGGAGETPSTPEAQATAPTPEASETAE